jgi:hypothetical protein
MIKIILNKNLKNLKFKSCIFEELNIEKNEENVFIKIINENIFISKEEDNESIKIKMGHSNLCPFKYLKEENENEKFELEQQKYFEKTGKKKENILIACAIILENTDKEEILITKRNKNMRIFPSN